jgi:nicotinamide phosphoribosyltransferase
MDVYKDPVTDAGKQSKRGRMTLLRHREYGTFRTVALPSDASSMDALDVPLGFDDALTTVWENGELKTDWTFADVRSNADRARLDTLHA